MFLSKPAMKMFVVPPLMACGPLTVVASGLTSHQWRHYPRGKLPMLKGKIIIGASGKEEEEGRNIPSINRGAASMRPLRARGGCSFPKELLDAPSMVGAIPLGRPWEAERWSCRGHEGQSCVCPPRQAPGPHPGPSTTPC